MPIYQNTGGSPTYSPTHTFRYTVSQGQEGSVQVTGLTLDASNFISDEAGNNVSSNIQTPLSVAELTIAVGDCVGTDTDADTGFNGGDGSSASSPYLICTYAQLNKMRDNLTAHYKLGQNINANDSWNAGADGCTAYDGSTVPTTDACRGWVPVGTSAANKCDGGADDVCFQGHLDGGDYIISNLYLNISGSGRKYGGLFGSAGRQAEISHLGLTDVSVTVTSTNSYSYGSGFVGYHSGTISNSYATGEVRSSSLATSTYSNSYSGGLVGYSFNGGTISNSYATVTVESAAAYESRGGGLVGLNANEIQGVWELSIISNSYATGEVRTSSSATSATPTTSDSYSGGLVGNNLGTISNSYATGEVGSSSSTNNSSTSYSGGLVGSNSGTISNSYAIGGDVSSSSSSSSSSSTNNSSTSYGGGFVGFNRGTISNSYATREVESSSSSASSANRKSSYSYGGGFVGNNFNGTISNNYATGVVSSTSNGGTTYGGGLAGRNHDGTLSGTHYFVDNSGTNGIGSGTCSGTCTQKTLVQLQALISTDVTDWSTDNWDFGTTTQLPRVKYATTATYCSDNTYTTQQTCEDASESWVVEGCDGDTGVTCGDVILGQ